MPSAGGWKSKGDAFRTPSPTLSDDFKQFHLGRDAQLARDLDLNSREDKAVFRDNPFAMAKRRAILKGSETNPDDDQRTSKQIDRAGSDKPTRKVGNIAPAALTTTKAQPILQESPEGGETQNGKRKATAAEPKILQVAARKKSKTAPTGGGWVNGKGQTVTSRPGKKTVLDAIDDLDKKKKGGKKAPNAMLKAKKVGENDAVPVFTKIPANAAPTADFPIVQGLERQKNLPLRSRITRDLNTASRFPMSPDSDEISPVCDLLTLIKGLPEDHTDSVPVGASAGACAKPPRSDKTSPAILSSYFGTTGKSKTAVEVGKPMHHQVSKTSPRQIGLAPTNDQLKTPSSSANGPISNPSTITHIGLVDPEALEKQVEQESSSSKLAYSSPLEGMTSVANQQDRVEEVQYDGIVRPKPIRSRQIEGLNALAALEDEADIWQPDLRNSSLASLAQQRSRTHRQGSTASLKQKCFSARSTFAEDSLDNIRQADGWSTLLPKRAYVRAPQRAPPTLLNSRARTPTLRDKFHMPLRIFDHHSSAKKVPPTARLTSLPRFTTPRHSRLFMPTPLSQHTGPSSSTAYTIHTIHGSQFGSVAKNEDHEYHPSGNTFQQSYSISDQSASHSSSLPAKPEVINDWLSAWKRPNGPVRDEAESPSLEVDYATRAFRFGRA